ncbi:hypothetical protein AVEN_164042-1 [Araneus ventricosus]|uniref:Endonuclease/exonuclease/phosphatase domain-containing protein n=1 Tax=Araneus ventricosus TaxID=182803 RepID=A0A4Y2KN25_ARAVE|nr:hypothetical protein AVEN_47636-1 [Araneus ventricosus]GBN03755.1 hypothetical protein AVEN_164042-1 [Araneus ventricosus]
MRHPLWGPTIRDHRSNEEGVPFVDFMIKHRLNVWNDPNSDPTFETTRAKSWIDVTVASEALDFAAHSWQFRHRKVAQKITGINPTLLDQLERSVSPEDLDRFVLALTATIQKVCTTYLKLTKLRPKTVPWWDAELEMLRNKSSALKRPFTRTLYHVGKADKKAAYKICRAKFRRTLSIKRDKSWAEF